MVVGVCTVELWIPESQSLKDKRQVLHSVKDRLRGKFNLSIAEVDGQDLWQKAVLGMACVANDGSYVEQVLEQALNVIKSVPTIELVRVHRELL
ncbi:MAG: YlxP-like protein [Nitrospira sp.]|nr:MAG: YlxP-like protein [Nitrospira sp.]